MRWVCIAQEQPISENIADVLNSLQPISFSTSNFSATTIDYKETIYNSISHKMKFQWSIPNFQHKKKWYISLDYPKTLKLDRRNEKWASLGRRNPVRPESIGNKLGFGSNGPRTQVCSNAGQNGPLPLILEIFCPETLFPNNIGIYHFFWYSSLVSSSTMFL